MADFPCYDLAIRELTFTFFQSIKFLYENKFYMNNESETVNKFEQIKNIFRLTSSKTKK